MMAVRPGRVLKREMAARDVSAKALASAFRTPSGRITDILNGKRGVSPEDGDASRRYFGNSAQFWLNLQIAHELALADRRRARSSPPRSRLQPRRRRPAHFCASTWTAARRSCASGGLCRGS